ncbi:MAG: OmpH family outer membrane protein [Bacteroidota bacterium]
MRNSLILFIAMILTAGIITNNAYAQSSTIKMGIVDVEIIVKDLPEWQEAEKQVEEIGTQYQDTLVKMQQDLQTRYQQYQKQKGMMQEANREQEEEELTAMQMQLQQYQQEKFGPQGELNRLQAELLKPIREKVKSAIDKVAKEEALTLVLDKGSGTVLFNDPKLEITYKVMDFLKRGE